jgi:hypothetical protein
VPYNSEVDGTSGVPIPGFIYSAGLEWLGFKGPGELDPNRNTGIPTQVIRLLNTPASRKDFHFLTH